jgi:hypothetical protein
MRRAGKRRSVAPSLYPRELETEDGGEREATSPAMTLRADNHREGAGRALLERLHGLFLLLGQRQAGVPRRDRVTDDQRLRH